MTQIQTPNFKTGSEVLDFFDNYALQKRGEIDDEKLAKEEGLIKSYWLESQNDGDRVNIPEVIKLTNWTVKQIGDEDIYQVWDRQEHLGYLENISKRHLVLHTTRGAAKKGMPSIDSLVRKSVNDTDQLDFAWLSGSFFQDIWRNFVLGLMPERIVKFKFEYDAYFERDYLNKERQANPNNNIELWDEERSATSEITERSSVIKGFLGDFQQKYAPFNAIKMLRVPAQEMHGGYDFWSWGKVTYRAQDFRQGRDNIFTYTNIYEALTERIENKLWLQVEKNKVANGEETLQFNGAPVTINFEPELPLHIFQSFISTTFDKGQGPLRLWGNPIKMGERKVHVYGIDMHLWQKVYFEITPKRLIAILPKGTCGNTVHRLVTNIQRFISPAIETYVGDTKYADMIEAVIHEIPNSLGPIEQTPSSTKMPNQTETETKN